MASAYDRTPPRPFPGKLPGGCRPTRTGPNRRTGCLVPVHPDRLSAFRHSPDSRCGLRPEASVAEFPGADGLRRQVSPDIRSGVFPLVALHTTRKKQDRPFRRSCCGIPSDAARTFVSKMLPHDPGHSVLYCGRNGIRIRLIRVMLPPHSDIRRSTNRLSPAVSTSCAVRQMPAPLLPSSAAAAQTRRRQTAACPISRPCRNTRRTRGVV